MAQDVTEDESERSKDQATSQVSLSFSWEGVNTKTWVLVQYGLKNKKQDGKWEKYIKFQ